MKTATVVLPDGYVSAEEFARDCGVELVAEAAPAGFSYDMVPLPNAFVQWKGTDLCMDFRCSCGTDYHLDGFFAYAVKCPDCGEVWQMPWHLFPRRMTKEMDEYWFEHAIVLESEADADAT